MKRRILIICPSNRGTIAICTLNLWKALDKSGLYEIKCILMYKLPNGICDFDKCDAFIDGKPYGGLKKYLKIKKQVNWIRKQKLGFLPEQTISTLFNCSVFNVLAGGNEIKTGIFHSPHQQAKSHGKINYLTTLFYYNFIFPKLDRLFCVSQEVKNSIIKSFHRIDPKKISVVYNAHDIDSIKEKSKDEIEDIEERRIFSSDVILYIGRFDRNKAPERALKAFLKSDILSTCQLVYIGGSDEKYSHELKEMVKFYGAEDRVHFIGLKQNPYKYLSRSKALISCSYSEGLPGVIIESLILGIPVISTNSSVGVWEIMSCENAYKNIDSNYFTPFGIITPNKNTENDVKNLSEGISQILTSRIQIPQSPFIEQVSFQSISNKFNF